MRALVWFAGSVIANYLVGKAFWGGGGWLQWRDRRRIRLKRVALHYANEEMLMADCERIEA